MEQYKNTLGFSHPCFSQTNTNINTNVTLTYLVCTSYQFSLAYSCRPPVITFPTYIFTPISPLLPPLLYSALSDSKRTQACAVSPTPPRAPPPPPSPVARARSTDRGQGLVPARGARLVRAGDTLVGSLDRDQPLQPVPPRAPPLPHHRQPKQTTKGWPVDHPADRWVQPSPPPNDYPLETPPCR